MPRPGLSPASPTPADLAACRGAAARRLADLLRRLAAAAAARARAGRGALRLLPPGRRRGRPRRRRPDAVRARCASGWTAPTRAGRCRCRSTARSPTWWRATPSRARCPRRCSRASRGTRPAAATRRSASCTPTRARVAGTVGAMMALLMGARDADDAGARLRPRRGDAAHQHRPRRRRGCPRGPALSAARTGCARPASTRTPGWPGRCSARRSARVVAAAAGGGRRALRARRRRHRALPLDCRPGIRAARLLYAEIGREVERRGLDSVESRAVVPTAASCGSWVMPWRAPALPSSTARRRRSKPSRFLVEAVAATPLAGLRMGHRPIPWWNLGDRWVRVIEMFERLERLDTAAGRRLGGGPSARSAPMADGQSRSRGAAGARPSITSIWPRR